MLTPTARLLAPPLASPTNPSARSRIVVKLNLIRVNINFSPRHPLPCRVQSKTGVDFRDVDTHRDPAAPTTSAALTADPSASSHS